MVTSGVKSRFGSLAEELTRFREEMERFFTSGGVGRRLWPALAVSYPPVNVWQDDNNVYAEAELPGLGMDDLEVHVNGGTRLTLKGRRRPAEVKAAEWHRQERPRGDFERSIDLPAPIDPARVEACLQNGVLTVKMGKSEAAKPRRIPVNGG